MSDERRSRLLAADAHARRTSVREFVRPLSVEAGAGTGKTTTLVARMLAWCVGPGWERARHELAREKVALSPRALARRVVDGVLAITFTEAATAEMGSRLRQAMAELAAGQRPKGLEDDDLPPREHWPERALALLEALERDVVHTIHGFCAALLGEHPLEAGVPPGFALDADETRLEAAIEAELEAFWRHRLALAGDPELVVLSRARLGTEELREALRVLANAGAQPADLERDPLEPVALVRPMKELLDALEPLLALAGDPATRWKRVSRAVATLTALADVRLFAHAALEEQRAQRPASLEASPALGRLLARLREPWEDADRKRLDDWSRGEFAATELKLLDDDALEFVELARTAQRALAPLVDLDRERLEAARGLCRELLRGVRARLAQEGVLLFQDLLEKARALLEGSSEVRAELRSRYAQVLVDEFQDTDAVQCALVAALALGDADARGGQSSRPGLYVVGDPKQSIYAFRSADLESYAGLLDAIERQGGERLQLVLNHRSTDAILAEVERVIAPVMQERAHVQSAFQPLVGWREEPGSPVEHWITWHAPAEARARGVDAWETSAQAAEIVEARALVADLLAQRQRGVPLARCAVLARASSAFDSLFDELRAHGIPYSVAHERDFYRRREVQDAAALVRAVADPTDHLALATALRSSAFGAGDAALYALWNAGLPELAARLGSGDEGELADVRALVERVARELDTRDTTPTTRSALGGVRGWELGVIDGLAALARLRVSLRNSPPDVFVDELARAFLIEALEAPRYLGPFRVANLERFFARLAAELEAHAGASDAPLAALRRALREGRREEDARPRDAGGDALQVLTIHGSKGLDFDQVWLVGLARGTGQRRRSQTGVVPRAAEPTWNLLGSATPAWRARELARRTVEAAESVRTLYVAMTRARDRLVLCGRWPEKPPERSWERANSHLELVLASAPDELFGAARERLLAGETHLAASARFQLARAPLATLAQPASESGSYPLEKLRADRDALAAARVRAEHERARPWSRPMSLVDETSEVAVGGPRATDLAQRSSRAVARLAGTCVHAVLERAGPVARANELLSSLEALRPACETAGEPAEVAAAFERARALLASFAAGALGARWNALAPHAIARELALVAEPEEAAHDARPRPAGYESGNADLVCLHEGRWIVVDYKTTPRPPSARIEQHFAQVRRYARTLQRALALETPPALELWYFDDDHVEQREA